MEKGVEKKIKKYLSRRAHLNELNSGLFDVSQLFWGKRITYWLVVRNGLGSLQAHCTVFGHDTMHSQGPAKLLDR